MSVQFTHLEDLELLKYYRQAHDVRCVGELYKRYKHLIFGVCIKYLKNASDSEDAVMEIFEKLHLDLKKNEVEHFKSWLYTVARNHCLMKLRKAGLDVNYPDELPNTPQYDDESQRFAKDGRGMERGTPHSVNGQPFGKR